MGAITDLFKSERGLYALALTAASTVLTALGHMTIDMWQEFNLYIFGIYVLGKTTTGTAALLAKKTAPAAGSSVSVTMTETATSTTPAAPAETVTEPK
jgi:hypothetical protein